MSAAASTAASGMADEHFDYGYDPTDDEVVIAAGQALDLGVIDPASLAGLKLSAAVAARSSGSEVLRLLVAAGSSLDVVKSCIDWLRTRFDENDVVELSSILPTGSSRVSAYGRLGIAAEAEQLGRFVADRWGHANLYYGANPRIPARLGSRSAATKGDVVCRRQVVFDHDDSPAASSERHEWEQQVLARHHRDLISCVVRSGNGLHVIYDIEPEVGIDAVLASQGSIRRLYERTGSDLAVANADRIFRLPNTLNIPTAAKRAKGRSLAIASIMDIEHAQ